MSVEIIRKTKCLEATGNIITSTELSPVQHLNLTVHLKRGGQIRAPVNLKTIGKHGSIHSLMEEMDTS